jgi:hypothetical protein
VTLTPRDLAGNQGEGVGRPVVVDTTLRAVDASKLLFYPQDRDSLARATTLRFTLTRPVVVTWVIVDAAGQPVRTMLERASLPAGTLSRTFDGKRADGTFLPTGVYRSVVTVDGTSEPVVSGWRTFTMRAFAQTISDSTPARGQTVTIYATTAEPLQAAPKLTIYQPGKTAWTVTTTKVATGKYRARITLKTGGGTGTVTFRVRGIDIYGGSQRTDRKLPIH